MKRLGDDMILVYQGKCFISHGPSTPDHGTSISAISLTTFYSIGQWNAASNVWGYFWHSAQLLSYGGTAALTQDDTLLHTVKIEQTISHQKVQ